MLLDGMGCIVVVMDWNWLGENYWNEFYYINVLWLNVMVFILVECEEGGYVFIYLWKMVDLMGVFGVIMVEVDLQKFECSWVSILDVVFVMDSFGMIILVSDGLWCGLVEEDVLLCQFLCEVIVCIICNMQLWGVIFIDNYL